MSSASAAEAAVHDDLRRRGRLRARLPVYQRRVERAREVVAAAQEAGPCAVMFSGGKDSTVLTHLARSMVPDMPIFTFDSDAETPWTWEVIEAIGERYDITVIETQPSLPTMLKQVGWRGYDGPERLPGDLAWTSRQLREVLIEAPARAVIEMGYSVHLLGLRAEESHGRKLNRRVRGLLYQKSTGSTIATPIADWEADDVFAYLTEHELPISRVYLQPDEPERGMRRSAAALLTHGVWSGSWYRLRAELPALWQELAAVFPDMRKDA